MTTLETIHSNYNLLLNSKSPQEDFKRLLEDLLCLDFNKEEGASWIGKALTAGRFDVALLLCDEGFEVPERVRVLEANTATAQDCRTRSLIRCLDYHFEEELDKKEKDVYALNLFLWTGVWFQLPNGEIEETVTWVSAQNHQRLLHEFYYDLDYPWDNQDGINFWDYFLNREEDRHALLTSMSQKNYDNAMACFPHALFKFAETKNSNFNGAFACAQLEKAGTYLRNSSPYVFDEILKKTGDFIVQNFNDLPIEHMISLVNGLILNNRNKESLVQMESLLQISPITYALTANDPVLLKNAMEQGYAKGYVAPDSYIKRCNFKKAHSNNVNFAEIVYWHINVAYSQESMTDESLSSFFDTYMFLINNKDLWQDQSMERTHPLEFLNLDHKRHDHWYDEESEKTFDDFFAKIKLQEDLKLNVKETKSIERPTPSLQGLRF